MLLPKVLLAWVPVLLRSDVLSKNIPSFAGPFVAFAHRFDVCPSDGDIVVHVRNSHFNRANRLERQNVWGNASLKMQLDDTVGGHVTLAVRSNNEWKENAFIFNFPGGACSALREHIPGVFGIMVKLAPALSDKRARCVFPPGEYIIPNTSLTWTFPRFKVMPYGHYRFKLESNRKPNGGSMVCLEVDCEVIPKT